MQQSGNGMNGMTPKVLELAQVLKDINEGESIVATLHATGAQPELCGLPSLDFLEAALNVSKDIYMQQMRTLSAEELRALGTLV